MSFWDKTLSLKRCFLANLVPFYIAFILLVIAIDSIILKNLNSFFFNYAYGFLNCYFIINVAVRLGPYLNLCI